MNKTEYYIGLMSGSSLDGIDIIASTFLESSFQILACETVGLPENLKNSLFKIRNHGIIEYLQVRAEYSLLLSNIIQDFIKNNQLHHPEIAVIHGHTVYHSPSQNISEQMVDGGLMAGLTNIDVLVDLRIQDIAKGGQGAPLAPVVERLINKSNCYINLGGICNISIHKKNSTEAYDIAPCNQLFNFITNQIGKEYDKDGQIGASGKTLQYLIESWQSLPYFELEPPKSLDNSWVETHFLSKLPEAEPKDLLHTSYQFVSDCIFKALEDEHALINEVIFTGGGAFNKFLMKLIEEKLNKLGINILKPDSALIDFKEALLMAYMGYLYKNNEFNTLPSATGASHELIAGGFYNANSKQ